MGAVGCWGRASWSPSLHPEPGPRVNKAGFVLRPRGAACLGRGRGAGSTVTMANGSTVTAVSLHCHRGLWQQCHHGPVAALSLWPVATVSPYLWQQCHRACGSNVTVPVAALSPWPVAALSQQCHHACGRAPVLLSPCPLGTWQGQDRSHPGDPSSNQWPQAPGDMGKEVTPPRGTQGRGSPLDRARRGGRSTAAQTQQGSAAVLGHNGGTGRSSSNDGHGWSVRAGLGTQAKETKHVEPSEVPPA